MQEQDIQSIMRAAEELVEQTRQALYSVDEIYAHVGVDPAACAIWRSSRPG